MKSINLRPAGPERDFGDLAVLFSLEQDEPGSESDLKEDYAAHRDRIIRLMAAEDPHGNLMGFNWATRSPFDANRVNFYVIVKPEQRGQGAGRLLYDDLELTARKAQIKQLQTGIRDNSPDCRAFAERRGFIERRHSIGMALDLDAFDDQICSEAIAGLARNGFQFTSMDTLGNTEEAQRKLYTLNDMTDMETPGSDGRHTWQSFEDFQKRVCQADWYKPDGQMVVIDTTTGIWAAMSAITRFEGTDYAYNLHTGVDKRYRGRRLGQAVKILALRHARDVLKVKSVRTHHNILNGPMIAIDRKFGYVQTPGVLTMEKLLE